MSVARARYSDLAITYAGTAYERVPYATIAVYAAGTTTPLLDTIYDSADGVGTLGNPFTADVTGAFEFYLESHKTVKLVVTNPLTTATRTFDFVPVMPDPGKILTAVRLDAYAGAAPLNTGAVSIDAPLQAAIDFLDGFGGGEIRVGEGTYRPPTNAVVWADNICVRGVKGKTVFKRPASSSSVINYVRGVDRVGFVDIIFDGNVDNNVDLPYPYPSLGTPISGFEMTIADGDDCYVDGCTFKDFNIIALNVAGRRSRVTNTDFLINDGDGVVTYASLDTFPNRYHGYTAIFTTGDLVASELLVSGCNFAGLRGPGMFVGGTSPIVSNCHFKNNHRSYGFLPDFTTHTPGGQIALAPNATDFVIANCTSEGPPAADVTALGAWCSGLELNTDSHGVVIGCTFKDLPVFGISLAGTSSVSIVGGSVRGCGIAGFVASADTGDFTLSGVSFTNNAIAVSISGTANNHALIGCYFKDNPINLVDTSTGLNKIRLGNTVVNNDAIPDLIQRSAAGASIASWFNNSATGDGIRAQIASTSAVQTIFAALNGDGSGQFRVFGDGTSLQRTSGTVLQLLDFTGAAALRSAVVLSRGSSAKARIGLDASDRLAFLNAAGLAATASLDDSGNLTILGDVTATGGVYTTFTPTLNQGGPIAATVTYARYRKFGKMVHVQARLDASASGIAGNAIKLVLPAGLESARVGALSVVGTAMYYDLATVYRTGIAIAGSALNISMRTDGKGDDLGTASDAMTVASGDVFLLDLIYELA